jgi:glutathione S-transferase
MVLNFKAIPYTQSWICYPDIAPLFQALSVPPIQGPALYTLPAIAHKATIPSTSGAMTDSMPIALHLDKIFPDPPLFPSGQASYILAS